MAGSLDVMVRFLADTAGVKDAVDDVEGTGSKIKDWAGKAALAIGGAFAVDKVVEFGKASIDAAAEDAKAQAILAQTLKNTAGATDAQVASTEKAITAMSKHYAVADDDLRPALGNLVRATGDVTKSQDLMQVALDASAGTGKDLNTITLAMGKAAQGSTGGLQKLGIATKDAAGHTLTADQVFANMAATFKGEAGAAADSTAGKMANAKIQFGEFQEQIGTYLLPVIGTLASFFTDTLIPAISGLSDWVAQHKDLILAAFIGFATVVAAVVIPAFITWAITAGAAAIATLAAAAPFIALGVVIAGVALLIIHNFDTIKAVAETVWNAVLGTIKTVWNWVHDNWPLLLAIITGPIGLAVLAITRHWDDIKAGATAVWQWIKDKFNDLVSFFTGLPGRLSKTFAGMWDGILNAFRSVINGVIDLWNKLHFTLPKIDLGPLGSIGGGTVGVPSIPHLAQGGLMTSSGLVFAHAGEVITPAPAAARSGPVVHIENASFSDQVDVDVFMARVAWSARTRKL